MIDPRLVPSGSQNEWHLNTAQKVKLAKENCVQTDVMRVCVFIPGYPTQAHSTTNYSSWCLSKNPTLNILHLEMYYVPSRWAEGQREHFCESYLIGFLHLVNCTFVLLEMSERDCPAPLPTTPQVRVTFLPCGHATFFPLGAGPRSQVGGYRGFL